MIENEIVEQTPMAYEKPSIVSYTEAELAASMEAWGAGPTASGGFVY